MGKVIEIGSRGRGKPADRLWRLEYLLFPAIYQMVTVADLPARNEVPAGSEVTLHPGNAARQLVNEQLLRILAMSPRELREAVFVTAQKILRFTFLSGPPHNFSAFKDFLKLVSHYVRKLEAVVIDNYSMHCWYPGVWLEVMDGGRFDLRNHLAIHTVPEKEAGRYWVHTHGMAQFACPDLEVRMVSEQCRYPVQLLLSRLSHYLFRNGPVFREGCRVAVVKGYCWATFKYHCGLPLDNHYRNHYFRIIITKKGREEP
ncbi:MAG: hypothetical protein K6T29_02405 [Peptococcaceae bacterium]|nr:hypothetical protein [Peptococcaceae bacterium]